MQEQNLLTGRVYDLDRYEKDNPTKSLHADAYFQRIGEIAKEFFRLRHLIPLTQSHNGVIDTVDGLIADHMVEYAQLGTSMLDVGGSTGNRILDIEHRFRQKKGAGLEKHVADIDNVSLAIAGSNGIHVVQTDLSRGLPYQDGTIDAVSSFWTFEIMQPEKHAHVINDIHRVLKPGGKFYFQDDKHGWSPQEERYFKDVLEPRGYKPGTFFYGVFEVLDWSKVQTNSDSVHPVSDRDPAVKSIGEPMYGKGFSLDEIDERVNNKFDMENIYLIEYVNQSAPGKIIASNREQVEKLKDKWAPFLTVLRKK